MMPDVAKPNARTVADYAAKPFIVGAVVILLVVATWASLRLFLFANSDEAGKFGDYFGVVNAVFSGLAFAALIYTVLLQREELKLQRLELQLTRGELKRQAQAMTATVAPRLSIEGRNGWHGSYLVVRNDGQLAATGLAIRCEPELIVLVRDAKGFSEHLFSELLVAAKFGALSSEEMDREFSLDPGERLVWLVKHDFRKSQVAVTVEYRSAVEEATFVTRVIGGRIYDSTHSEPIEVEDEFQGQVIRSLDAIRLAIESRGRQF